jgi:hypothetical protein
MTKTTNNKKPRPASTMKLDTNNATDHPHVIDDDKVERLLAQDQAEKARFKHLTVSFTENRFGPIMFALLFAGLGGFLIFHHSSAAPKGSGSTSGTSATAAQQVSLSLSPPIASVANGTNFTAEVWANALTQQVNAVEADLVYPVDKIQFVSIDSSTSAFSVSAEASGGSGKVIIARGSTAPVTGKQLVAKVTFKAIAVTKQATVSLASSSQLLRTSDSSNILAVRSDAKYRFTN